MTNYTVSLYSCSNPECAYHPQPRSAFLEDEFGSLECCDCGNEVKFVKDRLAGWISIAAYTVTREYGGPEEGGWYYDDGDRINSTLRCFEHGDFPQVRAYIETLERRYTAGNIRIRRYIENVAPAHFPEHNPRYS